MVHPLIKINTKVLLVVIPLLFTIVVLYNWTTTRDTSLADEADFFNALDSKPRDYGTELRSIQSDVEEIKRMILKLEGLAEQRLEGRTDGKLEGTTEGKLEGRTEGKLEGTTEGKLEGRTEGKLEGTTEGKLEGTTDGKLEGRTDGKLEGRTEGKLERRTEGDSDGQTEGAINGQTEGKLELRTEQNVRRFKNLSHHTEPTMPSWIETFAAPHWSTFKPWQGVFVFFVNYRHEYLRRCLEAIVKASADIDKSSVCVFALDKPRAAITHAEINRTIEVIQNVTFCKVFLWKVDSDRGRMPKKRSALRLKYHWWFVLESVFNATLDGNAFNGALQGHITDILFIEEDAILAPDFVKVAWFAGEVKRRNVGIIEYALGGWSGENMINAHPDTFVVRTARQLRGVAYGLNQSTWLYFKSLERKFFEDWQHDWCESMGLVLGKNIGKRAFRIVVPTLSRMWHVGAKGLGENGDFNWGRAVTSQPNWAYASRLVELSSARVNLGLRDLMGFLCKERLEFWYLKDMECQFSFRRWKGKDRHRIMCAKQAYVTDLCDVYVS